MSKSKRQKHRDSCGRKVKHSHIDAIQQLVDMKARKVDGYWALEVYQCAWCGEYHIGRNGLYYKRLKNKRRV